MWWGGAQITLPDESCSTGFALNQGSLLLTEARCGVIGDKAYTDQGLLVGKMTDTYRSRDLAVIASPAAGHIFEGSWSLSAGPTRSGTVKGSLNSYKGDFVCTNAAYSGRRCGGVVTFPDVSVSDGNGQVDKHAAEAVRQDGRQLVRGGDSGGPVQSWTSDLTRVYAMGIITNRSASPSTSCGGAPSGGECGNVVYYSPVKFAEAVWGPITTE